MKDRIKELAIESRGNSGYGKPFHGEASLS